MFDNQSSSSMMMVENVDRSIQSQNCDGTLKSGSLPKPAESQQSYRKPMSISPHGYSMQCHQMEPDNKYIEHHTQRTNNDSRKCVVSCNDSVSDTNVRIAYAPLLSASHPLRKHHHGFDSAETFVSKYANLIEEFENHHRQGLDLNVESKKTSSFQYSTLKSMDQVTLAFPSSHEQPQINHTNLLHGTVPIQSTPQKEHQPANDFHHQSHPQLLLKQQQPLQVLTHQVDTPAITATTTANSAMLLIPNGVGSFLRPNTHYHPSMAVFRPHISWLPPPFTQHPSSYNDASRISSLTYPMLQTESIHQQQMLHHQQHKNIIEAQMPSPINACTKTTSTHCQLPYLTDHRSFREHTVNDVANMPNHTVSSTIRTATVEQLQKSSNIGCLMRNRTTYNLIDNDTISSLIATEPCSGESIYMFAVPDSMILMLSILFQTSH